MSAGASGEVRALPYGRGAVLLEVAGPEAVAAIAAAMGRRPPAGVQELVPAARTVLVRFDPARTNAASMAEHAQAALAARLEPASAAHPAPASAPGAEPAPVVIRVVYDGADLEEVGRLCGMSAAEVVARHTGARYRCGFCGFAPGFSYLVGGDPALRVPRLDEPRPLVPAGSVALADEFSAVYPTASPGGWRLLGRTHAVLWDLGRPQPALIPPGTEVRFEAVPATALSTPHSIASSTALRTASSTANDTEAGTARGGPPGAGRP